MKTKNTDHMDEDEFDEFLEGLTEREKLDHIKERYKYVVGFDSGFVDGDGTTYDPEIASNFSLATAQQMTRQSGYYGTVQEIHEQEKVFANDMPDDEWKDFIDRLNPDIKDYWVAKRNSQ